MHVSLFLKILTFDKRLFPGLGFEPPKISNPLECCLEMGGGHIEVVYKKKSEKIEKFNLLKLILFKIMGSIAL
jgi:hypothetical protein